LNRPSSKGLLRFDAAATSSISGVWEYDIAERMGLREKIDSAGWRMRELRIVGDRGERLADFGARVFEEVTGGRFVTLGRSDLSRLLFETIERETEVIFGDEVIALKEGRTRRRRLQAGAAAALRPRHRS
jgi:hypothetical protein